ncbi:MAG: hypothetical protein A2W91_08040 [Bacteroidetes bacterium GWF2_38_335]|nr:MAG: hypothetical protein A2W91_08040 [Bacteroidetes bacterium GWF2_38_335]OFY79004.1 MAG: hypothetical protein A2281_02680 [Bacteroidetes bacterium RIFOXYA12_FULL_38_20]HBS86077.1 hypothetical protein [Bacteroidales bacterium]
MKKAIIFFALLSFFLSNGFAAGHTVSLINTNGTCNGSCDGQITAQVTGGVGPFEYAWTGPEPYTANTATITNLCSGTYSLVVTDLSDMSTATVETTLYDPPMMSLSLISNNECGGCDGYASANLTGGYGPYSFFWSSGHTTPSINNVCPGNYTVTAYDSNGCTASSSIIIPDIPLVEIIIDIVGNSACGGTDGSVDIISVTGGISPYTYMWSTGHNTQDITNLLPGTYCVTVADINGCYSAECASVVNLPDFTIVLDSLQGPSCEDNLPGYIGIHAEGDAVPFIYAWSGGYSTPVLNDIPAGNYIVTVTDETTLCIHQASYSIPNTYNIYTSLFVENVNCTNNGSAYVSAYGLHPPFTYLWSDSEGQTDSIAIGLSPGEISVTVTDDIGCYRVAVGTILNDCKNVISGKVFNDLNENCIQDPGEEPYVGVTVRSLPGYYYSITNSLGYYSILTPEMNNTIQLVGLSSLCTSICPTSGLYTANFAVLGDTISDLDFAIDIDSTQLNLVIHPGWTGSHPGFEKRYWCYYYNNSAIPVDATINFVYDTLLIFNYCTMGGVHDAINHTITWYFTDIPPAFTWDWLNKPQAYFTVPVTASLTDQLETYFEILPIIGDVQPSNNTLFCTEPITGSHDPNDKQVYPKGIGENGCIFPADSVLLYTIRFQNNGNDTAFTVVVIDTLSPNVDPGTLVAGAASHPYTLDMSGQGILTFRFDNILLPDSTTNEEGSKGYFNYSVHLKPGLPFGTVIENTAGIYFDYNEAVITNTVVNTLCDPTTTPVVSARGNASVYPNPFSSSATISLTDLKKGEHWNLELTDIMGRNVKTLKNISMEKYVISGEDLKNGVYFYHISSDEGLDLHGKIVVE